MAMKPYSAIISMCHASRIKCCNFIGDATIEGVAQVLYSYRPDVQCT